MLYSLLCATLWASTGIFIKSIDGLSVPGIILGRFVIAFICGFIFVRGIRFEFIFSLKFQRYREVPLSLMMTLYYVCATYSFVYAPVAMAALLVALAPLFTFLLRLIFQREFNKNELIGFIIAFGGLIIYFYGKDYITGGYKLRDIIFGGLFALAAAILRAAFSYIVWIKNEKKTPIDANFVNSCTLFLGVLLLLIPAYQTQMRMNVEWLDILFLLGLGVIATYIPNSLNTLSSMRLNPTIHNIIGMSMPIFASIMSWILLGEDQTIISVVAMFITVAGIYWSMKPAKERNNKRLAETVCSLHQK